MPDAIPCIIDSSRPTVNLHSSFYRANKWTHVSRSVNISANLSRVLNISECFRSPLAITFQIALSTFSPMNFSFQSDNAMAGDQNIVKNHDQQHQLRYMTFEKTSFLNRQFAIDKKKNIILPRTIVIKFLLFVTSVNHEQFFWAQRY